MTQKTAFERFDDRYQYVTFNNIDFRTDEEIHRLRDELNELPEGKFSGKKGAVIATVYRYLDTLKKAGDYVSKCQSTLHDNRLKTLIHADIILAAKAGTIPGTQIICYTDRNNPVDQINSKALKAYLEGFTNEVSKTRQAGEMYFLIYDSCQELLNLEI